MAQPSLHSVHIDAPLTNISVAYLQAQTNFIAPRVFPVVPVDKQSDLYFTYTKNDWFRDEAKVRPPASESVGSGYGVSTASYSCIPYAIHKDIPDQVRNNEDAPLNSDRDATEFVTHRLLLRQEIAWAAAYFTTSVWATDSTPGNLWDNYTTSDPISDVETGKRTILASTGYEANALVVGYDVFKALKNHPDVVDRYKYTSSEVVTEAMLARLFGVERLLVAKAVKATNNENETGAYDFVYGKSALLCHVAKSPSILTPSAGYVFAWRGVSGMYGATVGVKRFRMEHLAADRVEAEVAFDHKAVATDLGYFFSAAVS